MVREKKLGIKTVKPCIIKSAVSYNCWQDESVIKAEKAETALRTGHRHGNEIVHNSEDVLPMCGSTSLTVICSLTLGRT